MSEEVTIAALSGRDNKKKKHVHTVIKNAKATRSKYVFVNTLITAMVAGDRNYDTTMSR